MDIDKNKLLDMIKKRVNKKELKPLKSKEKSYFSKIRNMIKKTTK